MHNNKGITIITLVIAIVVIIIISGVTFTVGFSALQTARVSSFVAKMNMVQEKVNIAHTELANGNQTVLQYGQSIPENETERVNTAMNNADSSGFRYFTKDTLKQYLNLDGIDETIIINFTTREIYNLEGIEYENQYYYNQYQLPNGQYNISYENPTEATRPQFNIQKHNYGSYVTLNVTNIVFNGNSTSGTAYYGVVTGENNGNITVDYWRQMSNYSVDVTKSAQYAIKLVDKAGNEQTKQTNVAIVNEPVLTQGMIPIVFDEENGKWKIIENTDGSWYDYANKKWANIMLSDGTYKAGTTATPGTLINESELGSMFVWIPRYAYNITTNYQTKNVGNINIKFLKGTTSLTADEQTTTISNESGQNKWNVHPAFTNGSTGNYANGGWNKELTGMWVAKFESSSSNPGSIEETTNGGGDSSILNIKVLPNVKSWREISEENIFNNCLNMNVSNNIYGLPSHAISHQMKNSEWGAVSYLAQSIYGKNSELYINNTSRFITGRAGAEVSSLAVTTQSDTYAYDSPNGQKASSTGTIYGIYDLSGGALERTASYVGTSTLIQTNAPSIYSISTSETDTGKFLIETYSNTYSANNTRFGDAIAETSSDSTGSNSWNGDLSVYPSDSSPFIVRGGWNNNGTNAGIYAFDNDAGTTDINTGFRPVIII